MTKYIENNNTLAILDMNKTALRKLNLVIMSSCNEIQECKEFLLNKPRQSIIDTLTKIIRKFKFNYYNNLDSIYRLQGDNWHGLCDDCLLYVCIVNILYNKVIPLLTETDRINKKLLLYKSHIVDENITIKL